MPTDLPERKAPEPAPQRSFFDSDFWETIYVIVLLPSICFALIVFAYLLLGVDPDQVQKQQDGIWATCLAASIFMWARRVFTRKEKEKEKVE